MLTICFWNLNKKPEVLSHLICLAQSHSVDVFILAECPVDLEPARSALNGSGIAGTYREVVQAEAKVRALTRLGIEDFVHRFTGHGRYLAAWTLRAPTLTPPEALVVGVHLPSKAGGFSMTDQASVAMEVIKELTDVEDGREHRNTILIGDFNMRPYDEGMTLVTGFHGLMTKALAGLPDRRHLDQPRRRFYNPMWGLFGDRTAGPAGTYYWRNSAPHNTHWQMLDQVLVRSQMISCLRDLHILDHDGQHALVTRDGLPDVDHSSDHLPLLLQVEI